MSTDNIVNFNGTLEWAYLNKTNEMSGKYQLDLTNLSDDAVNKLKSIGLNPRMRDDKPEKGYFITVKSNNPIKAYDTDRNEIPSTTLLGNGTGVDVAIGTYDWSYAGKSGKSPSLVRLTVTHLKEYAPEPQEVF